MARPPKDPSDKAIKQSISIKPDLLPHLMHYCQVEERTMSWVIDKALREWLRKRGEEVKHLLFLVCFGMF